MPLFQAECTCFSTSCCSALWLLLQNSPAPHGSAAARELRPVMLDCLLGNIMRVPSCLKSLTLKNRSLRHSFLSPVGVACSILYGNGTLDGCKVHPSSSTATLHCLSFYHAQKVPFFIWLQPRQHFLHFSQKKIRVQIIFAQHCLKVVHLRIEKEGKITF